MTATIVGPGGEIEVNNDTGPPLRVDVVSGSIAITGISGEVEIKNDAGNPIPVTGSVNVANFPASVEVANDIGNPLASSIVEGGQTAEVNSRTDGIVALEVNDDCTSFEAQHVTLTSSTDTAITFAQPVRIVRVLNWDIGNRILAKDGAIANNTDATATRVGVAPTASVPGSRTFPFKTTSIHLRSAGASEVSIEGYF